MTEDEEYQGMSPLDEARSLKEFPLPPEGEPEPLSQVADDDAILPTRIAIIDSEIARIDERRRDLQSSRVLLLDHAIKTGHIEDDRYKIVKVVKKHPRVADIKKLETEFPDAFRRYMETMRDRVAREFKADAVKAAEKIKTIVNLGVADGIFGKDNVTKCSVVPETVDYEIIKRGKNGNK